MRLGSAEIQAFVFLPSWSTPPFYGKKVMKPTSIVSGSSTASATARFISRSASDLWVPPGETDLALGELISARVNPVVYY